MRTHAASTLANNIVAHMLPSLPEVVDSVAVATIRGYERTHVWQHAKIHVWLLGKIPALQPGKILAWLHVKIQGWLREKTRVWRAQKSCGCEVTTDLRCRRTISSTISNRCRSRITA